MLIVEINVLVSIMVMSASGCSYITTIPIEENIESSHLVIKGRITNGNETFYKVDIECFIKNFYKSKDTSIFITQIASENDGLCFVNNFEVHKTYILFLRKIAPNIYRPYSKELESRKLAEVEKACDKIKTCEKECFKRDRTGNTASRNSGRKEGKLWLHYFLLVVMIAVTIHLFN